MVFRSRSCDTKVQVLITTAWCSLCACMLLQSARALDSPSYLQLLWTYFAPVAPPLLMLWLWAQCNALFERQHIPFAECFPEHERRFLAPSHDLYTTARAFTALALACLTATALLCGSSSAGGLTPLLVPPLFYGLLACMLAMPVNVLRRSSRRFLIRTLLRVLAPLQAVSWADFLLADMLTSLAKSSSDLSRSVCLMLHGPLVHPKHPSAAATAAACGPLTTVSLSALVLPYFLRMLQCLSVWRAGGPRSQLFNAAKYASSLPALMLTALEHEYHVHHKPFPLRRVWIACMVLNSAYSFYWDVEQDWDMPWLMQHGGRRLGWLRLPGLRPCHAYSGSWYAWLLLSNLVLRFTWAHRLLGDLEAHNEVLMAVALLEVVRRWQWVFVRVETELRRLGLLVAPLHAPLGAAGKAAASRGGSHDGGSLAGNLQLPSRGSGGSLLPFGSKDHGAAGDASGGHDDLFGRRDSSAGVAALAGKVLLGGGRQAAEAAPLLVRHVSGSDSGDGRVAVLSPAAGLSGLLGWRRTARGAPQRQSTGGSEAAVVLGLQQQQQQQQQHQHQRHQQATHLAGADGSA